MKMKFALLILIIISTIVGHAIGQARPDPWSIKGKVVSATADGAIVLIIDDGVVGRAKPAGYSVVFVRGLKLSDDEPVNVEAFPAGTFQYVAVNGAQKIVRAFQVRK